jgi:NAD-dependent dihydropyrimidine dehydrogenase PreA subunit
VIELIRDEHCVDCNWCVKVCPTNVFDQVPGGHPVIARQEDCQTCFMCEAYCPTDALFVAPLHGPAEPDSVYRDEQALADSGRFGQYRYRIGWGPGRTPGSRRDRNHDFTRRVGA